MIKLLIKYKYQTVLVLIGLIWLVFLNELLQLSNQNNFCNDCDNYKESAYFLYHNFKTHYFRPIGMAIITGIPYFIGVNDVFVYKFSLIINILAWFGTALLLFNFLKKIVSNKKALLFSSLFYSIISIVFVNFQLLTESIFTFLIFAFFYFIVKYYEKKSFHFLSIAISILLFAMLIKPGIKFFTILIFFYFVKIIYINLKNKSILFIYISLFLIAFQYIKMKNDYGNYTLSYIDSVTYYNYLGSKAFCFKNNETFSQNNNKRALFLEKFPYSEQRIIASNDFLNQLNNNKINLIRAYISNLIENTKTPNGSILNYENLKNKSYFDALKKNLIIISKYQNRIFTIFGFILAFYYLFKSYKNDVLYSMISLYILYTIAISGVSSSQGDRFHIVFFPFVIILIIKFYNDKKLNLFAKK